MRSPVFPGADVPALLVRAAVAAWTAIVQPVVVWICVAIYGRGRVYPPGRLSHRRAFSGGGRVRRDRRALTDSVPVFTAVPAFPGQRVIHRLFVSVLARARASTTGSARTLPALSAGGRGPVLGGSRNLGFRIGRVRLRQNDDAFVKVACLTDSPAVYLDVKGVFRVP
jgi:hypothetical protein